MNNNEKTQQKNLPGIRANHILNTRQIHSPDKTLKGIHLGGKKNEETALLSSCLAKNIFKSN
jgi:hypothetical protein